MSHCRSRNGSIARARSERGRVGRSPCRLTTILALALRIAACQRFEDPIGAARRDRHGSSPPRPPDFSTHAAIASESVATTTGPIWAACARRMTRTIIGSPAISASGFPGSRVEAIRAGIRMRMSAMLGRRPHLPFGCSRELHGALAVSCVIRVATRRGKPAICAPRHDLAASAARLPSSPLELKAMDSFELNKILGAILGTCLGLLSINIAAGAIFAPTKPAKPGYEIAVPEQKPGGKQAPAAGAAAADRATSCQRRCRPRGERCEEMRGLPHLQQGRESLVGPNLWGVVGPSEGSESGFNYSAALKVKGRQLDHRRYQSVHYQSERHVPGTNMTFAGVPRATERADIIAYLNGLSDNPAPLPKAAEAAGAPKPQ